MIPITVGPNEISLGNTEDIRILYKNREYETPGGYTILFEDAGYYNIRVLGSGESFTFTFENRVPDDGTPNRLVINRSEEREALRARLLKQADAEAEEVRLQFITPGDGQAMTYQEKYQEAVAFLNDPEIDDEEIPLIVAEVGITGDTKADVASVVVTMRQQWKMLAAAIESVRLSRKKAINQCETVEELEALPGMDWSSLPA